MPTETLLELARRECQRLKALAERAMAQVTDEQFFAAAGPARLPATARPG